MALITAADWKTSRGIAGIDFDTRLDVAVPAAEAYVRRYCGRDMANGFESAARTEVYDGTGTSTIRLREWPVDSITSVAYLSSVASGAATYGDTVTSSGYYVAGDGELVRFSGGGHWPTDHGPHGGLLCGTSLDAYWAIGTGNIEVQYTGGYATVPADLAEACYLIVDWWWERAGRGEMDLNQAGAGVLQRAIAAADELTGRVHALLAPWMRRELK